MKVSKLKLHLAMARACMSIREVAGKSKVSSKTLANWGKNELNPKVIGKVAKALDVPVEELIEM
ncbi:MAG: helix-turn-helix transcriptional regulator [Eubacteriales bacterium]|nr:helix-turn-helix transcriptional regulator [Eubacteriales bacterium]